MKKKLLKYIEELQSQSFSGWTVSAQGGYETALTSIKEKVKSLGKPEYEYNVRRVYNSIEGINEFNKEILSGGWEITGTHRINESSSYIIFSIRKEKE
jgi:hypothetical protein